MARSSKKKFEGMDYMEYSDLCYDYVNKGLVKFSLMYDNSLNVLAKRMTSRYTENALHAFGTFRLEKDEIVVEATPVAYIYNNRLHAGVAQVAVIGVNKNTGKNIDRLLFTNSYSSDSPETVYEAIDTIADDVTEKAWRLFNDMVKED